jgi:hypothetical protein
MADLHRVCALLTVEPEAGEPGYTEAVAEHILSELIPWESLIFFDDWLPGGSTEPHVHRLESSGMTEEEKSLKSFTRRSLKAIDSGKSGMLHLACSLISIMRLAHSWA